MQTIAAEEMFPAPGGRLQGKPVAVVSVQKCRVSNCLFTLVKMMEMLADELISGWMVKHFAEVRQMGVDGDSVKRKRKLPHVLDQFLR